MMNRPSTGDRISELPDEILHCILGRIDSSTTAAQTIALSRQWRDIWRDFWSSYPIVKFDNKDTKDEQRSAQSFEKFCDAIIEWFSRDSLLPMEALILNLWLVEGQGHGDRFEKLLDLAAERKAEKVQLESRSIDYFGIPLASLSKLSFSKILIFARVDFTYRRAFDGVLTVSLNSLRFLHLSRICFTRPDKDLLTLIASSPLLETLELGNIWGLSELKVSTDPPNLKTVTITDCSDLGRIEIAASGLRTLQIRDMYMLSKFELTTPQLTLLEISECKWQAGNLEAVISKLPSLKSLTLARLCLTGVKRSLKFSSPKLEEFTLHVYQLEEIELNAGPCLAKFLLRFHIYDSMDVFQKCEINLACPWELDVINYNVSNVCFFWLKSLLARFPHQFSTVKFVSKAYLGGAFDEEEVDHTLPPVDIKHLIIPKDNKEALLDGLLWVMHPQLLSITDFDCSNSSFLNSLKLAATTPQPCHELSCGEEVNGRRNWRHQLKDVRIVNRNIDRAFTGEIKEEETISLSESAIASLAGKKQICFMLIWR